MKKSLISSILLGCLLMVIGCSEEGAESNISVNQQIDYIEQN